MRAESLSCSCSWLVLLKVVIGAEPSIGSYTSPDAAKGRCQGDGAGRDLIWVAVVISHIGVSFHRMMSKAPLLSGSRSCRRYSRQRIIESPRRERCSINTRIRNDLHQVMNGRSGKFRVICRCAHTAAGIMEIGGAPA